MCGIAGCFGGRGAQAEVSRMASCLAHRGPDDSGLAPLTDGAGEPLGAFGHRRLSILDLSPSGHQPMVTPDGRHTLIFNGEIYNFRELRRELEQSGVVFHGGSDTEVLLRGWARHGPRFLSRLRGMYALALWDRDERTGWLARDPFGIKPLYLAEVGGRLLFASELRALLSTGLVARRLSGPAVESFLATGSVTEPLTIVEGVRMLPAGAVSRVTLRGAAAVLHPPEFPFTPLAPAGQRQTDPRAASQRVRATLRDSLAAHMVSDVPVAFFLSGGIDSSAAVALASEVSGASLETFTIAFREQEFNEASAARAVADRLGCRHHEICLGGEDLLRALPAAFASMDQPSMDGLNTYAVSQAVASRGLKVVISGLGGDEMFAGYPSFHRARRIAPLWSAPAALRRFAADAVSRGGGVRAEKIAALLREVDPARGSYLASRSLFTRSGLRELAGRAPEQSSPTAPPGLTLLQRVSWYELTGYMRNTLLRDSDVFSMAHGLELRVPFVDREVAATSFSLADSVKLRPGVSKPVLVDAVRDLLPREVWDRPKQGFLLPFDRWMRGPLRAEVEASHDPARLERVGLSHAAARRVWEAFSGGGGVSWSRPWSLYTLVRWAEETDSALEGPLLRTAGAVGAAR